ncbi:MAG TPA: prepilin-type N-terminal cleavage/methylation domain-containing protein [Tepidisphaeraceae bacterium]|jgi:prepilin-type processing-associated H-X9-DG protein/prepilin-type N-terminal cleavage/methylation domain-containing protein|nr:prepilin-type N-terminal cleavage/methylation domain-containing protein [Tepidisphaeraceae bacterium]
MSHAQTLSVEARSPNKYRGRRSAFTLVELLVVIGIIALLISILLPSLNKARQQANLVDCSARLRQMGQAIHLYASQHKGYLPPTNAHSDSFVAGSAAVKISDQLGTKNSGFNNFSPVMKDLDVDVPTSWWPKGRVDYSFNEGLFVNTEMEDTWLPGPTPKPKFRARPMSRVRNSQEVAAAWDALGFSGWDYVADMNTSEGIWDQPTGGGAIKYGTRLFDSSPSSYYPDYNRVIPQLRYPLSTSGYGYYRGHPDFRHIRGSGKPGTTANVLFLDGHVEGRKVGELKVKDFCFPWR